MDVEKLQRLAGSVRTGGKGTMRRYVLFFVLQRAICDAAGSQGVEDF